MEVAILDAIAEDDDPSSKSTPNVPIMVVDPQRSTDVSFLYVCAVIDHEFRHHIVKVAVDPRGDSLKFMCLSAY